LSRSRAALVIVAALLLAAGASAQNENYTPAGRRHWAFQPRKQPVVPTFENERWVRSSIDAFVLANLKQHGLAPAPPASRRTLIRRLTFDLTGLPPTPPEVEIRKPMKSWSTVCSTAPGMAKSGAALARPGPLRRNRRL
jgi:hypothetical protein